MSKMVGHYYMMKWYTTPKDSFEILDYMSYFTHDKILEICRKVTLDVPNPKTIILCINMLNKCFPKFKKEIQNRCTNLCCQFIVKLSRLFSIMKPVDKEFFFAYLRLQHERLFFASTKAEEITSDANQYKMRIVPPRPRTESLMKDASCFLFFKDFITNHKLLEDHRFCIAAYQIMYWYVQALENAGGGFIQVLKDKNVITWRDEFPERNSKRAKLTEDGTRNMATIGQEEVLAHYYKEKELTKLLSKDEIKFTVHFMYQLVEKLYLKDYNAACLAVGLSVQCERKLEKILSIKIHKEARNKNAEFVHMNFMVRSY